MPSQQAVSSDQVEHQFKLAKLQLSESRQLPVERIAVLFLLMLGEPLSPIAPTPA